MEITYKTSEWRGAHVVFTKRTRKVNNKFTKFNLEIAQLCNLPNIDVMLEYAEGIRDDFERKQVKAFLEKLADESQKIIWAVDAIEKDLGVGESFTFETPAREI